MLHNNMLLAGVKSQNGVSFEKQIKTY